MNHDRWVARILLSGALAVGACDVQPSSEWVDGNRESLPDSKADSGDKFCDLQLCSADCAACRTPGWTERIIDGSGNGADGVDVGDLNSDGWPDITTGWEQSGEVMVYLNPGRVSVRNHWPAVDVGGGLGLVGVEDAVFADLSGDGRIDSVVTAVEKSTQQAGIHWLTNQRDPLVDDSWEGTWL